MEIIKKILVLITSLLMIGAVSYLIIISSRPRTLEPGGVDTLAQAIPEVTPEQTPSQDTLISPPKEKQEQPPVKKQQVPRDTIAWREAPQREAEKQIPYPSIGAVPPGNPNPLFISAARRILPSVVSIYRKSKLPDDIFHQFRRNPRQEEETPEEDGESEEDQDFFPSGSGSGIIISSNGYILTNNHVIEDAQKISVQLYDKREFEATVIGTDPTTDLALLKIDTENLPAALMGNSDSIQIGEWVMAVGNPMNFSSTITAGIVSAIGRNINIIQDRYGIENFIQTDAVINPGNSGGALVNLQGEVIGVNTAIATRTGLYQGYGFAIPINLAKKVVNDILQYGRVRRGLLGVTIDRVDARKAQEVGLPRPYGALIVGLQKGYPAEKYGLQIGDIILAVDDDEVVSVNDLQLKIARHHPGDKVKLTVLRDKKPFDIVVELGEAPTNAQ